MARRFCGVEVGAVASRPGRNCQDGSGILPVLSILVKARRYGVQEVRENSTVGNRRTQKRSVGQVAPDLPVFYPDFLPLHTE
jgi:hypothetical protein